MIDSPIALVLLGMSAVGAAMAFARRRRQPPQSLNQLSLPELQALRHSLSPETSVEEVRRVTLLLVQEEIERRSGRL